MTEIVSPEDLSDEEFETVVQSRAFQKMLLYQRLADGIEVIKTQDRLYDSMVRAITEHHSEIDSVDVTREVLNHFESEVATYTEPVMAPDTDRPSRALVESRLRDKLTITDESGEPDPEQRVHDYLEECLTETDELELKAKEIGSEIGLPSNHIGGILGQWRHGDDAPFAITATESPGSGNLWTIRQAAPTEGD